ncbi:MAG TPA: hypothetical protein ENI23_06375 [bacterium]|nr:hypothetical protein [bacterium]
MIGRIIRFIGLKIVEIGAILGIPYGLGCLVWNPGYLGWLEISEKSILAHGFWNIWGLGFITMILAFCVCMIIALICVVIAQNWEWAE